MLLKEKNIKQYTACMPDFVRVGNMSKKKFALQACQHLGLTLEGYQKTMENYTRDTDYKKKLSILDVKVTMDMDDHPIETEETYIKAMKVLLSM
jgi:hypothetical protein